MTKRSEALTAATDALEAAGVETPRRDALALLADSLAIATAELEASLDEELAPSAGRLFAAAVRRRSRREPVAYITGSRGFRWIELASDPRALVPRPETELLVDVALERRPRRVLEVGTGTGAVALAIVDELPEVAVVATEASERALALARENAERLGAGKRLALLRDVPPAGERFDLVLANLPYVPEAEWRSLEPEVRDWEPREALVGGDDDGLGTIRALAPSLLEALDAGGAIALEVGRGQAPAVAELLAGLGLEGVEARRDLAGIERVVVAERTG